MSLMAIILWALHALSPLRRLQESARVLLHTLLKHLEDRSFIEWLCANPDDPDSVPRIERMLDDLDGAIDLVIYQKAREHLGLRLRWPKPKRSPPQRRRTRSFAELFARLEACALRYADIDRLAQRRAEKLKRLLEAQPLLPRAGEAQHALTAHHANSGGGPISLLAPLKPATPFTAKHADKRARAPPRQARLPNANCPLPQRASA